MGARKLLVVTPKSQVVAERIDNGVRVQIPMRLLSEMNVREHWRKRADRVKSQRQQVNLALHHADAAFTLPSLPVSVKLTRIAPRPLDSHDNARASFKATVDAIAAWYGIKDNDGRIGFEYRQRRGAVREYAVEVEITRAQPVTFTAVDSGTTSGDVLLTVGGECVYVTANEARGKSAKQIAAMLVKKLKAKTRKTEV